GAPYRRERARIEREFASATVRDASHAGGAYHDDPAELAEYIDVACLGIREPSVVAHRRARSIDGINGAAGKRPNAVVGSEKGGPPSRRAPRVPGRPVGLVAPHIDPWRGPRCYGAAYNALATALPDDAETFILLGTSHAPMREPFALCRKTFATPLGSME